MGICKGSRQQTWRPRDVLLSFPVMTRKELATLLHMRLSCTWSQAAQLGDQAEEKYQEMCGDCCLVSPTFCPCSGMGDFVSVSPFSSSSQIAWCAKVFLPVSPLSLSVPLLHPPFTPWHSLLEGDAGEVGLWQDRAVFVRDDSFCDRHWKGGAPMGGCLQHDTSAAASVAAVSCQFLQFYGTFITICHSFNGMVSTSCPLPPATLVPPRHTHTHMRAHTLRSSAICHWVT